jgi:hypothetical protein
MGREALKLALEALLWANKEINEWMDDAYGYDPEDHPEIMLAITAIKAALEQPAHSEWNAALDEAVARIGEIKGFGQATQDSFAIYIKGLKK